MISLCLVFVIFKICLLILVNDTFYGKVHCVRSVTFKDITTAELTGIENFSDVRQYFYPFSYIT